MDRAKYAAYKKTDYTEAKRLLRILPGAVLLDVREEEDYLAGHAENARLLPLEEITAETAEAQIPNKTTPVFLYCSAGVRSAVAAEKLLRLGYRTIYDVGGLTEREYTQE